MPLTPCLFNLDAPAHLKKELDSVLTLQAEIDKLEGFIKTAHGHLQNANAPANALSVVAQLKHTHAQMVERVENLYSTLNVDTMFPDLEGLPVEFVRVLLAARDLKINVRKRAIANFLEWDRLDQAAGGRNVALGASLDDSKCKMYDIMALQ